MYTIGKERSLALIDYFLSCNAFGCLHGLMLDTHYYMGYNPHDSLLTSKNKEITDLLFLKFGHKGTTEGPNYILQKHAVNYAKKLFHGKS